MKNLVLKPKFVEGILRYAQNDMSLVFLHVAHISFPIPFEAMRRDTPPYPGCASGSTIFTTADAQVSPAPKATNANVDPTFARPSSIASASAIGIEAAEVFPYL